VTDKDKDDVVDPKFWQEFMEQPSTLPNDLGFHLLGFQAEGQAHEVSKLVHYLLDMFGRLWNLERLREVTISSDYNAALATIDNGTGTGHRVTATDDGIATGIAMAVPILVDGTPRIHLVLNAGLMLALSLPETPMGSTARYTVAHECCHIHDLAIQEDAFPGVTLKQQLSGPRMYLHAIAAACWSEYVACRLSANFASDGESKMIEGVFCSSLESVRKQGNDAIRKCRADKNYGELLSTIVSLYGNTMKYASYLLGHVAGLEKDLPVLAPKAAETLAANKFFENMMWKLQSTLAEMFENYGDWNIPFDDFFQPLEMLANEMLRIAGINLKMTPQGLYVGVPFNVEVDLPQFNIRPAARDK
jgi:hypothetical protein